MIIAEPSRDDGGLLLDARLTMYPTAMFYAAEQGFASQEAMVTFYGVAVRGTFELTANGVRAVIPQGSYFSTPGPVTVECAEATLGAGRPFCPIIARYGFRGQLHVGRVEDKGRLSYIDGCSDSMLVYPPRQGDPCLNHLHFPGGILQTQHTHPSILMGVVTKGSGFAWQRPGPRSAGWKKPLTGGSVFLLEEQELHSFETIDTEGMDIVAYHPDSDWGPTDDTHPMLNRTHIGAADLAGPAPYAKQIGDVRIEAPTAEGLASMSRAGQPEPADAT